MTIVTNQPVQVSYFVRDIAGAVVTYNRLRWHLSRTGPNGLYEARTGPAALPAVLDSPNAEPHQLSGKEIKFRVNGATVVSVVVAAADPVSTADLITEITAATALVTPTDPGDGTLRLTTVTTGTGASIEILDGDANPFLGWAEGDGATGIDTDTVLVAGTHEYFYTDDNSDRDYWYRIEFLHSTSGDTSGLGVPFPANLTDSIPKSQTIVGTIRLADQTGCPVQCRKVTFYNVGIPNSVTVPGQPTLWGVARQFLQKETDRNGYAEFRLLRGVTLDMNIEGGFTRRITVPTSGDSFDLLDPALVVDDEYGIQEPNIPFAIRTT